MKKIRNLCAISIWLLFFSFNSISGQTQEDKTNEFRSYFGRFGIELPNSSTYETDSLDVPGLRFDVNPDFDAPGLLFGITNYKWSLPAGEFSVSYADGGYDLETPEHSGAFLKRFRDLTVSRAGKESKLIREQNLVFDNHAGFELVIQKGEIQTTTRVFLLRKRFYILAMSLNATQRKQAASAERTLASFRLLPRQLLEEMLARQIEMMVRQIGTLPQEPFVARPTTDAQDDNFKGKIRKVVEEVEYYNGDHLATPRTLVSEMEFNDRGYLTKSLYYLSSDLPSVIIVYGYLGGERAAKIGPNIDLLRFKYKYNGKGQLIEKHVVRSNGKEFQTRIFDPSAKRIEQYGFLNMGLKKITYSLNDNGDPKEQVGSSSIQGPITYDLGEKTYTEQGRITFDYKLNYSYEFDSQNNWIKRVTSRNEKKNGKSVAATTSISYRTITYY